MTRLAYEFNCVLVEFREKETVRRKCLHSTLCLLYCRLQTESHFLPNHSCRSLFLIFNFVVYKTPGLTPGRGQNIYNCKYTSPPPPGQVCDVNIKDFEVCTQENNYSYHKSSPCVFLKLNKIYGWIPEYYNQSKELPSNMPLNLKEYIQKQDQLEV